MLAPNLAPAMLSALADPVHHAILARLAERDATVKANRRALRHKHLVFNLRPG